MDDIVKAEQNQAERQPQPPRGMSGLKLFGIIVVACIFSTLVALGAVYYFLFHSSIDPVELSAKEEQVLEEKLDRFDSFKRSRSLHKDRFQGEQSGTLQPERYSESEADREIILTQRELNAILAKNTDLADKLAIDLSEDLASAKLVVPLDEEFPLLGGKTLKVSAGLEMSYRGERPIVALRGVSLWGVPIPNAWLGNMKNVDLVQEFGGSAGFWKSFADGIDEVEISEGELRIKLKE